MWVCGHDFFCAFVVVLLLCNLCTVVESTRPNRRPLWLIQDRQRRRQHQKKVVVLGRSRHSKRNHVRSEELAQAIQELENKLAQAELNEDNENHVSPEEEEEDSNSEDSPKLNVTDKDSPYALISDFFPNQEHNHRLRKNDFERSFLSGDLNDEQLESMGDLRPEEVWLSQGNLLILKGGSTVPRDRFDSPWEPLDDYQAPYREPKLPPPDFIPVEHGVGVPLPREDEPPRQEENEILNDIPEENLKEVVKRIQQSTTQSPVLFQKISNFIPTQSELPPLASGHSRPSYNEEQFINEMENFHSIRKIVEENAAKTALSGLKRHEYFVHTSTPESFSYSFVASTTPAPSSTRRGRPLEQSRPSSVPSSSPSPDYSNYIFGSSTPAPPSSPTTKVPTVITRPRVPHRSTHSSESLGAKSSPLYPTLPPESRRIELPTPFYPTPSPAFQYIDGRAGYSNPVQGRPSSSLKFVPSQPDLPTRIEAIQSNDVSMDSSVSGAVVRGLTYTRSLLPPTLYRSNPGVPHPRVPPKKPIVIKIKQPKRPRQLSSLFKSADPKPSEIRSLPSPRSYGPFKRNVAPLPREQLDVASRNALDEGIRRSDQRYVSFFRGPVGGGQSWGYSYRL